MFRAILSFCFWFWPAISLPWLNYFSILAYIKLELHPELSSFNATINSMSYWERFDPDFSIQHQIDLEFTHTYPHNRPFLLPIQLTQINKSFRESRDNKTDRSTRISLRSTLIATDYLINELNFMTHGTLKPSRNSTYTYVRFLHQCVGPQVHSLLPSSGEAQIMEPAKISMSQKRVVRSANLIRKPFSFGFVL